MNLTPDRRTLLTGLAVSACATAPTAELALRDTPPDDVFDFWLGEAPGGERVTATEEVIERPNAEGPRDRIVRGVRRPNLSVFAPARDTGAALLIIPGGGYRHVVVDKEGYEAAR